MLFNFVKIAYRNLLKKRVYSFINILGLSIGAASSLLIFLYVRQEQSYDKFYNEADQLYRVALERRYPDRVAKFAYIPGGFAEVLTDEIPEIEKATRVVGFPDFASVFRYGDVSFRENYHFFADSNFFDVFDFKLLKGNPKTALIDVNTVILTESMAKKYFGDEDPIGKTLEIDTVKNEVVGIMQDLPPNTHFRFDFLSSTTAVGFLQEPSFYVSGAYTYIKKNRGADPGTIEGKLTAVVEKYAAGQIERELGITFKDYQALGNGYNYFLQPITDIHLHSQLGNEFKPNGNVTYVNMLVFIGFLILIIAGINFVNLATARSTERAKEVGVRKVLGSRKKQLVSQFLSESLLISAISIVIAIALIQLTLATFNSILPQPISFDLMDGFSIATVLLITIGMGLVAGLYPAFYISSLKPVTVLKGKMQSSSKGNLLRRGLIVFQFSISIILISATLVVNQQLDYIQQKELGFNKENLLVIEHNGPNDELESIRKELEKIPGIESATFSNANPGGYFFGETFRQPGQSEVIAIRGGTAGDNFDTALGIKLLAGRTFSPEFNDSLSLVLNQSAVKTLGLTDPVGTRLENSFNNAPSTYTVVGVVEDFNYESLHSEIAPLALFSTEGQYNFSSVITLRLEPNSVGNAVASVEAKWKEIRPGDPFIYSFLDNTLENMYTSEKTSSEILTLFTTIAIVIACFGLFGLAAYSANQRTKEIGVRKVLGATVPNILNLLSQDFTRLVLISFLIGSPIAYFMMNEWLQSFAYRTSLTLYSFFAAGILILVITYVTISYQAIKAATANPVNSLKEE